jgi:hypothetical protein
VQLEVDTGTTLTDSASKGLVAYEVVEQREDRQTIRFWAKDVPSLGYKFYQLGRGQAVLPGPRVPLTVRLASQQGRFRNRPYNASRASANIQ